jgi:hypothetical protein
MVYKNYPTKVEYTLEHTRGFLEGIKFTDRMGFIKWSDACLWANRVTQSKNIEYIILEMKDLNTNEVWAL